MDKATNYVIAPCKFFVHNYCKNWNGKGNFKDQHIEVTCPPGMDENKAEKCPFYVKGKTSKK